MSVAAWQIWLGAALVLAFLELTGAHFIMLGLAIAAAIVALVVILLPELGLTGQLLTFAVAVAVTIPAIITVFRRYFPVNRVTVMNEPGQHAAAPRQVVKDNGRIGVKIRGDFYPAEYSDGRVPDPGDEVVVEGFRGIVARVRDNNQPQ